MRKQMGRTVMVLSLMYILSICGCGNRPEEINYPQSETKTQDVSAPDEKIIAMSPDGRIRYDVTDSKGTMAYKIDAEVIRKETDYPVIEVMMSSSLHDHALIDLFSDFFDRGTMEIVLPPDIAQQEYVRERIALLENRAKEYDGSEVPKALKMEIGELTEIEEKADYNSRYTIPCPKEPIIIDLQEYYDTSSDYNCDAQCCFIEGKVDGELYRVDYIYFNGSWSIRIYRPENYYGMGDRKYIVGGENNNQSDFESDDFNPETAANTADVFMGKILGVFESDFINCYPVNIFGDLKETGEHYYDNPGYLLFSSVMPSYTNRPVTCYTDFYGDWACSTNPLILSCDVTRINKLDDFIYNSLGYEGSSFENLSVVVDEKGVEEVIMCNTMGIMKVKTSHAELLPFEKINETAQRELSLLADQNRDLIKNRSYDIDRIQLGMTKVESDGHSYLIPAWYFFKSDASQQTLPEPLLCLNAIDGSTIDIAHGGITSTLELDAN